MSKIGRLRYMPLALPLVIFVLWGGSSALAQGSIFGLVQNSDLSVPANGEIIFFGYINGTDEEIRTESSIGAGYDNGNWFDDFQNYLGETAGQPYQYRFLNTTNGEGFVLDNLIPDNSFQQENVGLTAVAWPPPVENPDARAVADGKILLVWDQPADHTFHIYRRLTISGGSFYRIDNPAGSLSDPGIADNHYIDTDVDGISSYDYLIVAENQSAVLGPHSEIVTVNSSVPVAPVIEDISPKVGYTTGGTAVTISGSGFDTDGASVTIGSELLVSTVVVSPFEITGETPPGSAGPVYVFVTNVASGLSSNVLDDVYTYVGTGNHPPVLYGTGSKNGLTDEPLTFTIGAIDPDGDAVNIIGRHLPEEAVLTYEGFNPGNGRYEAVFAWTPGISQAGLHDSLEILAYDWIDTTRTILPIMIFDNGFVCGDADGNWVYNLLDIMYLIAFRYNDPPGPAPVPLESGDATGDGSVNLLDILYMIAFLYGDPPGPGPVCPQ